MKKPNNYDNTPTGDYVPVELGGHVMKIKDVTETRSKNGRPMIIIRFDFAAPDKQAGYFADAFEGDIRPDKKWPYQGTAYIVTEDEKGNCSRNFRRFTDAVEKSNPGFEIVWGDAFGRSFTGKLVGGVFGEVEEEYEGEIRTRRKLRWFCDIAKAPEAKIPEKQVLPQDSKPAESVNATAGNYPNIPADGMVQDDDIPF